METSFIHDGHEIHYTCDALEYIFTDQGSIAIPNPGTEDAEALYDSLSPLLKSAVEDGPRAYDRSYGLIKGNTVDYTILSFEFGEGDTADDLDKFSRDAECITDGPTFLMVSGINVGVAATILRRAVPGCEFLPSESGELVVQIR